MIYSHAKLADLSARAYIDLSGVTEDLEFFIYDEIDATYVAIRGSEVGLVSDRGIVDMVRNARMFPWYNKATGWAHGGFLRGAREVARALEKLIPKHRTLILTGHSLGAAVAVLCAQILEERGRQIDEVVLFGSPRIYLARTPKLYFPVANYRNGSDIITYLPQFYTHPVPLTELAPNNKFPNFVDHRIASYQAVLRRLNL